MNKKTVTIGIPAHNEATNIGNLLTSLRLQKGSRHLLEFIMVISDGSTDDTVTIAKKFAKLDKRIKVISDGKRLGKSFRVNQICNLSESEIVLMLDADVVPQNALFINEIVKQFKNSKTVLVGGHDIPCDPTGLSERIISSGIKLWHQVRNEMKDEDCIHNVHGCVYAVHKKMYKRLKLPKEIMNDDMFIFLSAHQLGYKSSFAKDAIVFYQPPTSFSDFYKQAQRFFRGGSQISHYFGNEADYYFKVGAKPKWLGTLKFILQGPVIGLLALFLQLSVHIVLPSSGTASESEGIWNQVSSTKKSIKV